MGDLLNPEYTPEQNLLVGRLLSWRHITDPKFFEHNFSKRIINAILRLPPQVQERAIVSHLTPAERERTDFNHFTKLKIITKLSRSSGRPPIEIVDLVMRAVPKVLKQAYSLRPDPTKTDMRSIANYLASREDILRKLVDTELGHFREKFPDEKMRTAKQVRRKLDEFYSQFRDIVPTATRSHTNNAKGRKKKPQLVPHKLGSGDVSPDGRRVVKAPQMTAEQWLSGGVNIAPQKQREGFFGRIKKKFARKKHIK